MSLTKKLSAGSLVADVAAISTGIYEHTSEIIDLVL